MYPLTPKLKTNTFHSNTTNNHHNYITISATVIATTNTVDPVKSPSAEDFPGAGAGAPPWLPEAGNAVAFPSAVAGDIEVGAAEVGSAGTGAAAGT